MRILDVGGSMMQRTDVEVDTLVDLIRPEDAPYGPTKLRAKHFVQADITRDKLPFKDKEFDYCYCTHTLEDLPTPFPIMDEISRVSRGGLIVTPSMGYDMKFTKIDFTNWLTGARRVPGQAHHKWFFIKEGKKLKVIPKNYPILYTSEFQIVDWMGDREMNFEWSGRINYLEVQGINIHKLIDEYKKYINENKEYMKIGTAAIFIDSPIALARALAKKILKRGSGYKYRDL